MLIDVGRMMGTRIVVLITDMEQPLGRAIGNALEIRECIEFLNGNASDDLETVSIALAAQMIRLGGRARTMGQAAKMAYEAVSKGAAAKRFRQIIETQGGDARVVDHPDLLPRAAHIQEFRSASDGFVSRCDARLLGLASSILGAGRQRLDDTIDPAVGLYLEKKLGDRTARNDVLCRIHWNDPNRLDDALELIEQAFEISPYRPERRRLIHTIVGG
jgi:thymidine phosphorylase